MWLVSGFDGIVDDWEQRKLGELMSFSNGVNAEKHAYGHGIKMISVMDILDKGRLTYETVRNSVQLEPSAERVARVNNDDLVFVRSSETPTEAGWAKVYSSETPAVHSGFTIKGKKLGLYDGLFVESFLNTIGRHQLNAFASGSTHFNIGQSALIQTTVSFPLLAEQHQIADLIELLEGALALHERKLALLKKLKTAYLQQLFPENGNTTPRLRFAEFADDWEQRKLGDVVTRLKSYPLSRDVETTKNSGYRYIHYGDIHTRVADVIDNENMLPKIYPGKYETIETGDLCLADASEDYQDIAAPSVLLAEHKDNIVAGLHTIALRPEDTDPLFLYFLFKAPAFRHYVYREGQGLKVFGISARSILNYTYVFPSITEQAKIVKLLRDFDTTIALHQRKLESVRELKQAYLQKLFV